MKGTAVLIYDGKCTVCVGAVGWIRRRSLPGAFEFLSCHAEELAARFPDIEKDACMRAAHLVLPDGTVLAGEAALPEIFLRLRRYRYAARLLGLPGIRTASRVFYRWFAGKRYHLSGMVSD
jgi:predicted DCC family thiol-disulfide oxidoreductase YuxK